jgi:hypothetical protein
MATPVKPTEPSTPETVNDPNSITNMIKKVEEQKKQASSDTKYDTKANIYEGFTFTPETKMRALSIGTSFLIAAGILMVVGALLPKSKRR